MNAIFTQANLISNPIENGDCGIILRKNGNVEIFSTGEIDPDNLTEMQTMQGKLMIGVAMTLNIPELRKSVLDLASNESLLAQINLNHTIN